MAALNPLAAPKGTKLECELCQKPAYVQCTHCRYTFYCCPQHQEEDWLAIHGKICPIVAVLRAPQPHANSEDERQQRSQQQLLRKEHIITLALQEGRRFLCEKQPHLAIPAALEALRILTEVHGGTHINLTPAYLILAEAAIGLGRATEANQYLAQAQWSVLKAPTAEVDPLVKSGLHRNLGLLAASKSNFPEAKRQFAEDVYQATVANGTDSVEVAGGYYHLAAVFLREGKPDVTISLHDRVVSIWCRHLKRFLAGLEEVMAKMPPPSSGRSLPGLEPQRLLDPGLTLDVIKQAEASSMLHAIKQLRESDSNSAPYLLVLVCYTLAILYIITRDLEKAKQFGEEALQACSKEKTKNLSEEVTEIKHLLQLNSMLKSYLQS